MDIVELMCMHCGANVDDVDLMCLLCGCGWCQSRIWSFYISTSTHLKKSAYTVSYPISERLTQFVHLKT